jgi:ABC-type dipeptide/oligopeptide/nickel transport system permease subunit
MSAMGALSRRGLIARDAPMLLGADAYGRDDVATWGTMLHDASNVALLGDAPWTLAPAVPIFLVTLGVNVAARDVQRASI